MVVVEMCKVLLNTRGSVDGMEIGDCQTQSIGRSTNNHDPAIVTPSLGPGLVLPSLHSCCLYSAHIIVRGPS